MRAHRAILAAALFALLGEACVIDTVPLPDERNGGDLGDSDDAWGGGGEPADGGAQVNSGALYYTSGTPSLLVGAQGAVPASRLVRVTNDSRPSWLGEATATADGSFYIPVVAAAGEELLIEVLDGDGGVIATETLLLEPPSALASQAFADSSYDAGSGNPDGTPAVELTAQPPDADGVATVSCTRGVLPPAIVVVIANVDGGNAISEAVASDGSFTARILADSGDELAVLLTEAAVSSASPGALTVLVP